jgi:Tfp pilus assembly protein PilO
MAGDLNIDLKDLDLKKIGSAPLPVKLVLVLILCAAVAAAGYFLFVTGQLELLDRSQR